MANTKRKNKKSTARRRYLKKAAVAFLSTVAILAIFIVLVVASTGTNGANNIALPNPVLSIVNTILKIFLTAVGIGSAVFIIYLICRVNIAGKKCDSRNCRYKTGRR